MTTRDTGAAGFTLLELLVVLGLLGLLSLLVVGGLRFGSLSWTHADQRRLETADMSTVMSFMHGAIARAYPGFVTTSLDDHTIAFDGRPDVLTLVTPLPAAIEAGVLADETFFVEPSTSGVPALFMAWHLDLPSAQDTATPPEHRVMLLNHVGRVMFGYFGSVSAGQAAGWLDTWSGHDQLPELVRVRIERVSAERQSWPDMIAEPRATTTVACRFEAVNPRCRRLQ